MGRYNWNFEIQSQTFSDYGKGNSLGSAYASFPFYYKDIGGY